MWFWLLSIHKAVYIGALLALLVGSAGFGLRKIYKEHREEKKIEHRKDRFIDCLDKAQTESEYEECYKQIKTKLHKGG